MSRLSGPCAIMCVFSVCMCVFVYVVLRIKGVGGQGSWRVGVALVT